VIPIMGTFPPVLRFTHRKNSSVGGSIFNFGKFGQGKPIPEKSSKVTKFRRYEALDPTPNVLSEGITPTAKKLVATDVTATLVQYGDVVTITDVVWILMKIQFCKKQ